MCVPVTGTVGSTILALRAGVWLPCRARDSHTLARRPAMRTTTAIVVATAALAWPAAAKDPAQGKTPGAVYEAYMSPQQQPGEETEAPKLLQKATGLENTA